MECLSANIHCDQCFIDEIEHPNRSNLIGRCFSSPLCSFMEFGHRSTAFKLVLKHAVGMVSESDRVPLPAEDDFDEATSSGGYSMLTDPVYMIPILVMLLGILYRIYFANDEAKAIKSEEL